MGTTLEDIEAMSLQEEEFEIYRKETSENLKIYIDDFIKKNIYPEWSHYSSERRKDFIRDVLQDTFFDYLIEIRR